MSVVINGSTGINLVQAGAVPVPPTPKVAHTVYTGKTTYAIATAGQTGTYVDVLDTTITPSATSSRIRIDFDITYEVHNDTVWRLFRVINGVTTEVVRNDDGNYWAGFAVNMYDTNNSTTGVTNHFGYLDSPNTVLPVTYRMMIQSGGVGATTLFLNRVVAGAGSQSYENGISQCILTEVLA